MVATAGKNFDVLVSTDDATYYELTLCNSGSHSIAGDNQDITSFGQDWIVRIQGLKDGTYSFGGFFDNSDTTGQIAVRNALINDSALYVKVEYDGTNGYKQQVRVASFDTEASVDGVVEYSIELEGTGAVTAVP